MHLYDLSVIIDHNTCHDCNNEDRVDCDEYRNQFANESHCDNIAESGGRKYRIAIPEGITIAVDVGLYQLNDGSGYKEKYDIAGKNLGCFGSF